MLISWKSVVGRNRVCGHTLNVPEQISYEILFRSLPVRGTLKPFPSGFELSAKGSKPSGVAALEFLKKGDMCMSETASNKHPPKRKRSRLIKFFVNEDEYKQITARLKKSPYTSMSEYLRNIATKGMIVTVDYSSLNKFTFQLRKIGVNLNQIAKVGNRDGAISLRDVSIMQKCMKEINGIIKEIKDTVIYAETRLTKKKVLKHLEDGNSKVEG